MSETRKLQYRRLDNKEVIHEVDVTGRHDREVERITMGMLRNMRDDLYVHDTADGEPASEVGEHE